jgi:hypothetical protein
MYKLVRLRCNINLRPPRPHFPKFQKHKPKTSPSSLQPTRSPSQRHSHNFSTCTTQPTQANPLPTQFHSHLIFAAEEDSLFSSNKLSKTIKPTSSSSQSTSLRNSSVKNSSDYQIAETPAESYTVLNDLQAHPIRYRSWNWVLLPERRPVSKFSNNDYVPRKNNTFDTKKFVESPEEDHFENIRGALITGNLRTLLDALGRAPSEYSIGFGLMICSVLLYSHYSTGFIGGFNYDEFVNELFRAVLITIDQKFDIGGKIEQFERDFGDFEEEQVRLANLDVPRHSFTTRAYIWARDVLFPDDMREVSKWKQKRHEINEGSSIRDLIKSQDYHDSQNNRFGNPHNSHNSHNSQGKFQLLETDFHKKLSNDPSLSAQFEREKQRDNALIELDQLRLQMIKDNRGVPLSNSQEYILRQELRRISLDFGDLDDNLGVDHTMSEIQYDEFNARRDRMEQRIEDYYKRESQFHETTGLRKIDPFENEQKEMNSIAESQEKGKKQLALLGKAAQQKHFENVTGERAPGGPLTTRIYDDDDDGYMNNRANEQPQQGLFGQIGSWLFSSGSSNPEPIDPYKLGDEIYRQRSENIIDDYGNRIGNDGKPTKIKEIKFGNNDDDYSPDYALEMMQKVDPMTGKSSRLNSNDSIRKDSRRDFYGDFAPPRVHHSTSIQNEPKSVQNVAKVEAEIQQRSKSWFGWGSSGTRLKSETPSEKIKQNAVEIVQNPFSWLDKRDKSEMSHLIQDQVNSTILYRDTIHQNRERSGQDAAPQVSSGSFWLKKQDKSQLEPQNTYDEHTISKVDDDAHANRLKGGLFGGKK